MIVLDTNIVIYLLQGRLSDPVFSDALCISIVSEIELLSKPDLDRANIDAIQDFVRAVEVIPVNNGVKDAAILLRREQRLRLPDAIIAATALTQHAELFTNDERMLRISGVPSRRVALV